MTRWIPSHEEGRRSGDKTTPIHSAVCELTVERHFTARARELEPGRAACDDRPRTPESECGPAVPTARREPLDGVLATDLQHRSRQPVHQRGLHRDAGSERDTVLDGWPWALSGPRVHRRLWRSLKYEAVYLRELKGGFEAQRVMGRLKSRWRSGVGEPEQRPVASTTGRWPGNMERGLVHISTGWDTPPAPGPHYRHLFESGREGGVG